MSPVSASPLVMLCAAKPMLAQINNKPAAEILNNVFILALLRID
jgi:hypothetical protein